jgi:hypothetical protein
MKLSRPRLVIGVMTLIVSVSAGLVVSLGGDSQPTAKAASGSGVWIQTMDSCKNALGGASYEVVGTGISATTPAANPSTVTQTPTCPLEHGDCVTSTRGCLDLTGLAPGSYTIRQTVTPPANATNPGGYAPCEGGSACRWQKAVLTVGGNGSTQATVTNVEPDGTTTTNTFAGTSSDPIVFHDFGIGTGICTGDGGPDDHLTGTPSPHCAFPKSLWASACQPFPWSCTVGSDNAVFVHEAYETMLGHDVDQAGLSYWLNQLNAGTSRQALSMALATSPEYRSDVIGGNAATGVQDFYDLYLHRQSDAAGVAYWVGRMAGIGGPRLTFEQVRLQFVGSWEYSNVTHPGAAATITALYHDVLGRPASQDPQTTDPAGFTYWLSHFNVNTIASQFLYSAEGRQYLVETVYQAVLGRAADPTGLAYWTQQLLDGASDENIIASIQSSSEYYFDKASLD